MTVQESLVLLAVFTAASASGCTRRSADAPVGTSDPSRSVTKSVARKPTADAPSVRIGLAHGTDAEDATGRQLRKLLTTHDLSPWLLTRQVVIDEKDLPHSHPVLTLHTRHLRNDDHLLSTFLHEQMHWRLEQQPDDVTAAVAEAREVFGSLPVGFPDGARDEQSSYEHLFVIRLEYDALLRVVGAARADVTFAFWERDHYRALYHLVRTRRGELDAIARRHNLLPAAATKGDHAPVAATIAVSASTQFGTGTMPSGAESDPNWKR